MRTADAILIFVGGIFAGIVNAMAGGGSLLTVPLLAIGGLEGLLANGTNRVGVLFQSSASGVRYAKSRLVGWVEALKIVTPALAGGVVGSVGISQVDDQLFERLFGFLMIPMLIISLWKPHKSLEGPKTEWPTWLTTVVFFGVGVYAGAVQAGVGLIMLLVLSRAGHDLVKGNVIKTYVNIGVSLIALPVFILEDQVRRIPALVLSAGTAIGGYLGAHATVEGGERIVRPVLVVAVIGLAGRMTGLWSWLAGNF